MIDKKVLSTEHEILEKCRASIARTHGWVKLAPTVPNEFKSSKFDCTYINPYLHVTIYSHYTVTEIFKKFRNLVTTILAVVNLKSIVSVSNRELRSYLHI